MKTLTDALEKTLVLLRRSESSIWSSRSVQELVELIETEYVKSLTSQKVDAKLLKFLFGPIGSIQDTSIDNGWGDEFIEISSIIDQHT
jgi:hypothetical protein